MKHLSLFLLMGALLLSGCESTSDNDQAGIEGTGDRVTLASAYGTVSGFGSIYVNGVHFETDSAEVEIAGVPATEEALAVGMVVEVVGEVDAEGKTGVAQTIRAQRVLLGVIESVADVGHGRKAIGVLGQTVYVNEDATFAQTSFAGLALGDGVSISGFVTDNGLITATYVARQTLDVSTDTLEVEGYVSALDAANETLQLQDLQVQIGSAEFRDGEAADLALGIKVRIIGRLLVDSGILQASRIELDRQAVEERGYTSLEGVVRNLDLANFRFTLHGTVIAFGAAEIENGAGVDLRDGMQVVAIGPMQQGVLQAERLHIKPVNTSRFRGIVTNISSAERRFTLLDNTFQVTKFTQFKDESRSMERYFNFDSLRVGEELDVFAVNLENVWQVTRIMRRETDMDRESRDFVRGEASRVEDGRGFYIANLYIDGSELPGHEWAALREHEDEDFAVEVEGFYTDEGHFRATHVRVRSEPPCDPRVFFECDDDRPLVTPRRRS